jgi:hypothetical protein
VTRAALALPLLAALGCRGPAGAAGAPGTNGGPGLSQWEMVEQRATLQPSSGNRVTIQCPAGKRVLSGGWAGGSDSVRVASSRAIKPDTWEIWFLNSFGMTQEVTVSAICAAVAEDAGGR